MPKPLLIFLALFAATAGPGSGQQSAQPVVRVEPLTFESTTPLQQQTVSAAIRDYLESWQSFRAAFEQNRADLLDRDFVGSARDKLADTIQSQAKLGIRTSYQDRAHDFKIVFYSPQGLSIELTDDVDYDVQVFDHDKSQIMQRVHARYIVVLTPAEVRWRVRVFQAKPE